MPEAIQGETGAGPSSQKTKKLRDTRLRLIFWLALAVFGFFLLLYIFDRNPSKGLELLTTNVLSLAVLVVICVQAYIYSRQRKHMEDQSGAMREQLDGMGQQQRSVEQQILLFGVQAEAMVAQWNILNESLEETRKIVAQNERAMIAAEKSAEIAREAFYVGEAPYFGTSKIVFRWAKGPVRTAEGDEVETRRPELIITFMNGGKTPAWHFFVVPHLELGEFSEVDKKWNSLKVVHDNECPDAENTFYPSGSQKCIKYRAWDEFSSAEIEAINSRTQTLILIIDLFYTDMRNDRKNYTFLRCFNPITGRFGDCGAGGYA